MTASKMTSELVLYRTEDGRTRIQCRFEDDTLWLTQAQMAELFQTSDPSINQHLTAIFDDGELAPKATIKSHLIVRQEGTRLVSQTDLRHQRELPARRRDLPAVLRSVRKGRQAAGEAGPEAQDEAGKIMTTQSEIGQQFAAGQRPDHHARVPC